MQKEVKKKKGLFSILLLILFFPLSLIVILSDFYDSGKTKNYFYCPNCNYSEEIKIDTKSKKESKKEEVEEGGRQINYFWLFIGLVAFLLLVVGIILSFFV